MNLQNKYWPRFRRKWPLSCQPEMSLYRGVSHRMFYILSFGIVKIRRIVWPEIRKICSRECGAIFWHFGDQFDRLSLIDLHLKDIKLVFERAIEWLEFHRNESVALVAGNVVLKLCPSFKWMAELMPRSTQRTENTEKFQNSEKKSEKI